MVRLQQAVYTSSEVLNALLTRCTTPSDPHGNAPLSSEHYATNRTFLHPLCGAVNLHGKGLCTCPTGCVRILESPVVPCTLGVRLGTTLIEMHHTVVNIAINEIYIQPLYGHVQLFIGGPCKSPTGSVHILGSAVAPCAVGVRLGRIFMPMQHSVVNTLSRTEFLYTCCTALNSTLAAGRVRLPQPLYIFREVP